MQTTILGTTNADKPFEKGEVIDFCDTHYRVEANHGNSGSVHELGTAYHISPFYWTFEGAACRRVVNQAATA